MISNAKMALFVKMEKALSEGGSKIPMLKLRHAHRV